MTDSVQNPVDQGLSENLRLAASVARVLVLVGQRQHDRFITPNPDGTTSISSLEGVLWSALEPLEALWCYDPATKTPLLSRFREGAVLQGELPTKPGTNPGDIEKEVLLTSFLGMTTGGEVSGRMALLIDAALLWEEPGHPRETDHDLLRGIEHFARTQPPNGKLLILRTANLSAIPPALTASPSVRVVSLPNAGRDERMVYGRIRGQNLAKQCGLQLADLSRLIANATDDWRLEDMEGLIRSCEQQNISSPTALEATARAFRLGVARSPWAGSEIQKAIKDAKVQLEMRVRGQPEAISEVCTALRKATAGLSGAHQSGMSRGPRAVMFFAGPTGTGKTESAKAIAQLIYGDDSALVRFDCAEFRQDHSVARLIGAPPGYVGYEAGGELTDKIRSRPHSVLLFDEIEKAHPRLLDIFLSILDDGRLTNGQGVTADFSECVLIFTSNLGIYEETTDSGRILRRPRFGYESSFADIQASVRDAIREEFISVIGRPELLGRLGGEQALIVFDFLRDLNGVAKKNVDNIIANVKRLHDIDLSVDPSVIEFIAKETAARPDALVLGARGMWQMLNSHFSNPLADFIVEQQDMSYKISAVLQDNKVAFSRVEQAD